MRTQAKFLYYSTKKIAFLREQLLGFQDQNNRSDEKDRGDFGKDDIRAQMCMHARTDMYPRLFQIVFQVVSATVQRVCN